MAMKTTAIRLALGLAIAAVGASALASTVRDEPIKPIEPYVSERPDTVALA